ncbi:MAG: response regulator transcription factor [Nostocaceae cyanobacterium]|nr:response regulator transcription factor [Nostocaceae cyanobacterium]
MQESFTENKLEKILVIDDHESVLFGTIQIIKKQYNDAEIATAENAQSALKQIEIIQPDVVVMDLSIPEKSGETGRTEVGIELLRKLLKNYPTLNIIVQSAHIKTLVRIKPEIDAHQGGFTIADKSLSSQEMLRRVDWAFQGLTHTKDIKGSGLEIKPECVTLVNLAFNEGLTDKAIAARMCVSERMVRHYWTKLQDALEVYPEEKKNIRIQTEKSAREMGLID